MVSGKIGGRYTTRHLKRPGSPGDEDEKAVIGHLRRRVRQSAVLKWVLLACSSLLVKLIQCVPKRLSTRKLK